MYHGIVAGQYSIIIVDQTLKYVRNTLSKCSTILTTVVASILPTPNTNPVIGQVYVEVTSPSKKQGGRSKKKKAGLTQLLSHLQANRYEIV